MLATSRFRNVSKDSTMAERGRKKRKRREPLDPLEAIKRLLILSLAKQGTTTSDEVARVLETSPSAIRTIVPFRMKKAK